MHCFKRIFHFALLHPSDWLVAYFWPVEVDTPFLSNKTLFSAKSEPRHLRVAGLASTTVGTRYFGHWLRDDCIQYLLAKQVGAPICVSNPASEHKSKYAGYFGQDWTPTDRAFIDDL